MGGDIDIIATDAFITRFEPEKIEKIYRTFHSALRPGGHLLTTIRHPMEEEAGGLQALEREGATAQYTTLVAKAWAMFCRDHPGAERIVDGELLKELASVYTENMKSRHGKDEEAERLYAKSALSLAAFHDVSVPPGPGYAQGVVMALRGGLKPIKCELSLPCLDISPRQCQLWDLQRPKEEN